MANKCCGGGSSSDDSIEANASSGTSLQPYTPQATVTVVQGHSGCSGEISITPLQSNDQCLPPAPQCGVPVPSTCCTPPAQAQVKPYYQQASMCPEDNTKKIIIREISMVFKTRQSFAMPACGARIRVVFDGITDVPTESWLWAYAIGFLKIVGFNPYTQEIELENPCPESTCYTQVAPGTVIPACTIFTLTIPPCSAASPDNPLSVYPYLNSGFVAPANGNCIDIAVTNVNGLSVNRNVAINTGTYRISAIVSPTLITICNDGAGLTPGTVVQYEDSQGNLIVPIVLIDSNPCLNDTVLEGTPLVCDAGVTVPLIGSANGQFLVYDSVTGKASFRTVGIPVLDCTELTTCLTLDPALPSGTAYLISVTSTASYIVTDIVTIGGTEFEVTQILNATQMRIRPIVDPVVIQVYPPGSILCAADCCTVLNAIKANAGVNTDITDLDGIAMNTWAPVLTLEGGAVLLNQLVQNAIWAKMGPWIQFQLSVTFDVTNVGPGSTIFNINAPTLGVLSPIPLDAYTAHSDDNGAEVPSYWRLSTASNIIVFQAGVVAYSNGPGRIDIDGKYRAA